MPARRRRKLGSGQERFANAMLEAIAKSTGAGWFSFRQRSRLVLLVREAFSASEDAGKLHTDEYLELLEADATAQYFPNNDRPEPDDEADDVDVPVKENKDPMHISVEDVQIVDNDGPDFSAPDDDECSGPSTGGPMHIECSTMEEPKQ